MTENEVYVMKLSSGRELRYLSQCSIEARLSSSSHANDASLANLERSDLTTHVYEGGFKVWECARDICELLEHEPQTVAGKTVLELGCGAGLPSLAAIAHGAKSVILQDFNAPVLECFTRENARLNDIDESKCTYEAGPWEEVQTRIAPNSCDVILTSETIYNEDDYGALHDIIAHSLSPNGVAWVAAKLFYFGLSGCAPAFSEFVKRKGMLAVQEKKLIKTSVPRIILELTRIR